MKKTMILVLAFFTLFCLTSFAEDCNFVGTDQYNCATYLCEGGCIIVICPGDPASLECD
ncbi:hypothetical protein Aconfl_15110 [Algoriphagus confluentis]|uniref:Uncharacterized protein n=1 Tax=Algoriphagus confluentis TaxID=1697556 RepID=A0ABQ6PNW5_9BACT|nr:hypothetical protein Aconfl_15110 [Algoriphagus confluentis]